jgi:hypothetical protein
MKRQWCVVYVLMTAGAASFLGPRALRCAILVGLLLWTRRQDAAARRSRVEDDPVSWTVLPLFSACLWCWVASDVLFGGVAWALLDVPTQGALLPSLAVGFNAGHRHAIVEGDYARDGSDASRPPLRRLFADNCAQPTARNTPPPPPPARPPQAWPAC